MKKSMGPGDGNKAGHNSVPRLISNARLSLVLRLLNLPDEVSKEMRTLRLSLKGTDLSDAYLELPATFARNAAGDARLREIEHKIK